MKVDWYECSIVLLICEVASASEPTSSGDYVKTTPYLEY